MPIEEDIRDHEVLGREYWRGWREGLRQREREAVLRYLRILLEHRFGNLPPWLNERLDRSSAAELEAAFGRALDAATDLSQFFG